MTRAVDMLQRPRLFRHLTFATFRYQCFGNPVLGGEVGRCGLIATATTAATTLATEAIAAVDGPVAAGQERYGCLIAAFGANHAVHLTRTTVGTETAVG